MLKKTFFLISNYIADKLNDVTLITAEKNLSKKLKNIEIIYPKSDYYWRNNGRLKVHYMYIFTNKDFN